MTCATGHFRDTFRRYAYLAGALAYREIVAKYRGSYLGIAWSMLYPLAILGAFAFVFGRVIEVRWPGAERFPGAQPLLMYCGLVVFGFFSETIGTAPRFLLGYQTYIKKTVFPSEILPVVLVAATTFHALINLALLMLGIAALGQLHESILLLPLVLLPMWLITLGLAWFLAALGAYLRDIVHVVPVVLQLLMFLSPVFYPIDAVPAPLRGLYAINPIASLIELLRDVAIWGRAPEWTSWAMLTATGVLLCVAGCAFFMRCKSELADVL